MGGSGMLAAASETVDHRLQADVVAVRAVLDALVHLSRDVLGLEMVRHRRRSSFRCTQFPNALGVAAANAAACVLTVARYAASVEQIRFVVEGAGCTSCAARIRGALAKIATVDDIAVDETADLAAVRLVSTTLLSQDAVRVALQEASEGAGHEYRIQADSWLAVPATGSPAIIV